MRIKKDYPIPYIETLLQNYDSLSAGLWFETEDGKRVKPSSNRAPFEAAIIAKTDIDMAIDSLSPDEQDVIKRMYFEEKGLDPDAAPTSFNLVVRSQPHDFGSYYEVAARYDDINADAADLAYFLESEGPTTWDDEAKKELQG